MKDHENKCEDNHIKMNVYVMLDVNVNETKLTKMKQQCQVNNLKLKNKKNQLKPCDPFIC